MNRHGQTICLNMIVKNEAPVIRRCLDSVRPIIDYWVIVDTGSSDGTREIIREHMRDIPGELIERPWVDFAHNRSEALEYARGHGDYVFVIDADETLQIDPGFEMPNLEADSYNLMMQFSGVRYLRKQLVKNSLPWRYVGVLHEYIYCPLAASEGFLPGLHTMPHHDGARARDPLTYRRDVLMLERDLLDDPDNSRSVFYLAQSYRDAGDQENALRNYRRRVEMGGWPEEVWYSLYQIANIRNMLKHPWPEVMQDYLAAYEFKPARIEPLFRIAIQYQSQGKYMISHIFLAQAMQVPPPPVTALFVEFPVYEYLLPLEYAVSCYYTGKQTEAIAINNRLLREGALPPFAVGQVIRNRRFSLDRLYGNPPSDPVAPGRLKVCIPLVGANPDECINSLLQQSWTDFDAFLLDGGSGAYRDCLPDGDSRFKWLPGEPAQDWEGRLVRFLGEQCEAQDVVFLLTPDERLADAGTLEKVRDAFHNPNCHLAYGQYRLESGQMGMAEPAPDADSFAGAGASLCERSAVGFRAEIRERLEAVPGDQHGQQDVRSFVEKLVRSAGFDHTHFLDDTITVVRAPSARHDASRIEFPVALNEADRQPMISCLMVTLDRLSLARQSIRCYADQTYSRRELVIVTDGSRQYRQALERYVEEEGVPNVRFVYPSETGLPLGRLRNIALAAAQGEVICQWDDDDLNYPSRLAVQLEAMLEQDARAGFFTDQLHLLSDKNAIFWIDWSLDGAIGEHQRMVPGTLMMYKDERFRYPETGQYARQGEDSALLEQIYSSLPVATLRGQGYLYVYQYHGRNTFSQEHHYRMSSFGVTASHLQERESMLRDVLRYYPIARPLNVVGRDGIAFVV